jgi:hypothetical protein
LASAQLSQQKVEIDPAISDDLFLPDEAGFKSISFALVNSAVVNKNWHYSALAKATKLQLNWEDSTVNAYAHSFAQSTAQPLISFCGGIVFAHRALAVAVVPELQKNSSGLISPKVRQSLAALGRFVAENGGGFTAADLKKWIESGPSFRAVVENNVLCARARSYANAMHAEVLAHELGHIILGHCCVAESNRHQISRNQEREADSFAASVAVGQLFAEHFVIGGILSNLMLAWISASQGATTGVSTHPASEERVRDYIRSHIEEAATFGVTPDNIHTVLP